MTAFSPERARRAEYEDLDDLARIETAAFSGDLLSRRALRYYIFAPGAIFLVVERAGRCAAYLLISKRRNSTRAQIYSLAVDPPFQGRGLGRFLLESGEREARLRGARSIALEVRGDNERALQLYQTAGFERVGVVADFYEDGQSALKLEKRL